jgi:2-polyprenyl-6-methoxyphenol hydroxylase-like FAD-dependent oxidoreductase
MPKHVEIAGGGIGGLGLGMMLARKGWSVRIHERSPAIREVGAGISLRNNCIEVLERYAVFDRLKPHGTMLTLEQHLNSLCQFVQKRDLTGKHRTFVCPRQAVVDVLGNAARETGAEIVTSSRIISADRSGSMIDENGTRYSADLVVAADGLRSRVRDSLGIGARLEELHTNVNRYLIPMHPLTRPEQMLEIWSGDRRVGIMPCGNDKTYIYLVMPVRDQRASRMPLDAVDWSTSYPKMASLFDVLAQANGTQSRYSLVRVSRWSFGRVALIGDAAHGMPPTLGQGAGLTMMNSHVLSELLSSEADIEQAMDKWEWTMRSLSDATCKWAIRYDRFTRHWPRILQALRPRAIWAIGGVKFLNERMRIADKGLAIAEMRLRR